MNAVTSEITKEEVLGMCRESLKETVAACVTTIHGTAEDGLKVRRAVLRLALKLGNQSIAETVLADGIAKGGIPDDYDFGFVGSRALAIGLGLESPHSDIRANLDVVEAGIAGRRNDFQVPQE